MRSELSAMQMTIEETFAGVSGRRLRAKRAQLQRVDELRAQLDSRILSLTLVGP